MTTPLNAQGVPGGVLRRFGFRFLAAYLLIYNLVALVRMIPLIGGFSYLLDLGWNHLVFWAERVALGMANPSSPEITGSGDTSFLWARNGCMLALALAAALVWSFFDRARQREPMVREFLRVFVRYALAVTLIGYAVAKLVPPVQFPAPAGPRLLEPIGRLSPMGMLWVFMGASKAYTAFGGIMELIGGVLLFWRRTTPLGALVSTGVLLNIVLLNFCYDVPVKIYSLNLLLMAVFLLWPEIGRLAGVLVLNRATSAPSLAPPLDAQGYRFSSIALKVLVLCTLLLNNGTRIWKSSQNDYKPVAASLAQMSGLWNVRSFRIDGVEAPPLLTDNNRWRRIIFDERSGGLRMIALGVHDQWIGFWMVSPESTDQRLVLRSDSKEGEVVTLVLGRPGPDKIAFAGAFRGHPLAVDLDRADKVDTRLFSRGFHWISEEPFIR